MSTVTLYLRRGERIAPVACRMRRRRRGRVWYVMAEPGRDIIDWRKHKRLVRKFPLGIIRPV